MEEIVEEGRTGLHFTPGDSQDLAEKVQWAWDHPERMQQMGREARQEYERKYTAEKNYPRLMQIYREAIAGLDLQLPEPGGKGSSSTIVETNVGTLTE